MPLISIRRPRRLYASCFWMGRDVSKSGDDLLPKISGKQCSYSHSVFDVEACTLDLPRLERSIDQDCSRNT